MRRWADAKTIPAFTDLFRANPLPLPASAMSSLSSEDEIWIKPGSRAVPPVLHVSREPPVLRKEPSAIGQTLGVASLLGEQQPLQWRREVRHLGSTVALLLGALAFIGAANRLGIDDPVAPGALRAGLVLILGALIYQVGKKATVWRSSINVSARGLGRHRGCTDVPERAPAIGRGSRFPSGFPLFRKGRQSDVCAACEEIMTKIWSRSLCVLFAMIGVSISSWAQDANVITYDEWSAIESPRGVASARLRGTRRKKG